MKKILLIAYLLFFTAYTYAQKRTEDIDFTTTENSVTDRKSLYTKVSLIDARPDSTFFGILQKGAFNAKARVVPEVPIREQLQKIILNIPHDENANGELVVYLRQLSLAEVTTAFSEKGYCYFQAYLFAKKEDGKYYLLDKEDSMIQHSAVDVTQALKKKSVALVNKFLVNNSSKVPLGTTGYTYEDIKKIDEFEKQELPLYTQTPLSEGGYKSYKSFKMQKPDFELKKVEFKGDKISKVTSIVNGKEEKLKKDDVYAVVYQTTPYIYLDAENAFVKMEKKDGDFLFTGKAKATADTGNIIAATVFFGVIGGLIAAESNNDTFLMKLDHLNGGHIHLKEVKKSQESSNDHFY